MRHWTNSEFLVLALLELFIGIVCLLVLVLCVLRTWDFVKDAFERAFGGRPVQAVEPARQTSPSAGPSVSAALREKLRQGCRTSGDFEAFCLDHFPEIYKRFSSGMERAHMENLLLQHARAEDVASSLDEWRAVNAKAAGEA